MDSELRKALIYPFKNAFPPTWSLDRLTLTAAISTKRHADLKKNSLILSKHKPSDL